ncbi:ABC transporter permease [Xylanimonas ulmi]|uniref:NitT/TauT family transport system permease protein n=1 Tax=Xylanimonas ulmi TaxID=228973 RepID=A0A4Q7M0I4_9MICO|nr:ABC transporter permease subunit [Xylanibacterium ulmi]RZS60383.1 NitT/TauT family transport system permease protein [Xylanibacterium ulmi]
MRATASIPSTATLRAVVAPVLLGALAIAAWQGVVVAFHVRPFVVPSPSAIAAELSGNVQVIGDAALGTARNALIGFVVGVLAAVGGAALAAAVRVVDRATAPLVTAASVVPIVALAPVLYTAFGTDNRSARVVVAAITAFIPVYVNSLRGLNTVAPIHRDLLRAYAATPWQATRTVTLPGALPYFCTGLRIASSVAVISALVAEYFGGPVDGLGKAITSAVSSSRYALAWAYVVGAVVIGLVFYCATYLVERAVLRGRPA